MIHIMNLGISTPSLTKYKNVFLVYDKPFHFTWKINKISEKAKFQKKQGGGWRNFLKIAFHFFRDRCYR